MDTTPTIQQFLDYAEPLIKMFISQHAFDLPEELQEEIYQSAQLRLLKAHRKIKPDMGWKSFAYRHSEGAVLDYLKFGKGFQEHKWSIAKPEEHGSKHISKINRRVVNDTPDGDVCDVEQTLGFSGVFSEIDIDAIEIRWELVRRMARIDQSIHAMGRYLLGHGIEEMADPVFDKCRSRIGQLIQAFVDRFDEPLWASSPWFLQMCYAFGLCKHLGLPDVDQSTIPGNGRCGWDLEPIDLETLPEVPNEPEQQEFDLDI